MAIGFRIHGVGTSASRVMADRYSPGNNAMTIGHMAFEFNQGKVNHPNLNLKRGLVFLMVAKLQSN